MVLLKLVDNIVMLVGGVILVILLMIGTITAFCYYPITTGIILTLWLLSLLICVIDDKKIAQKTSK